MLFIGGLLKLGRNYIKIMAQIIAGRLLQKLLFTVYHCEEVEEQKQNRARKEEVEPGNADLIQPLCAHSLCTMEHLHMAPEKYH